MDNILKNIKGDRWIWICIVALSLISALAVYSSTKTLAYSSQNINTISYLLKHLVHISLGLVFVFICHKINFKYYFNISRILLLIAIPALIYTMINGVNINSAQRWITIPIFKFSFQVSDLAKLAMIMYTASILPKKQHILDSFKEAFLPIFVPLCIICALIVPSDFSTAALIFITCYMLMFIGRIKTKHLVAGVGIAFIGILFYVSVATLTGKTGRIATWKNRIESYVNNDEPQNNWQVTQANIAIAESDLLFGKGPGRSTQSDYLPSPYADYIYVIIIEEYGLLLGGGGVLAIYLILLFRSIQIFTKTPKAFGALLAVGLVFSIVLQAFINMAVNVGLLPVTGLVLPFISRGGTSLIFSGIALGIVLSVSKEIENDKMEIA